MDVKLGDDSDDVEEEMEDPNLEPGEVAASENGDFAYRIEDLIGEGRKYDGLDSGELWQSLRMRCCLVYSAHALRDNSKVAIKCYKRGNTYHGAIQREQHLLQLLKGHSIVSCYGNFWYKSIYCQVMELLDANVRQIIFRNDRKGLPPFLLQKFAKDILSSLESLHSQKFVHADLKPANVMWSPLDGAFKLLDFGLSFHTAEANIHQIQTKGYQAPEAAEWNRMKEEQKRARKRKLQGTFANLNNGSNNFRDSLTSIGQQWPSESSGVFTASEIDDSSIVSSDLDEKGDRKRSIIAEEDEATNRDNNEEATLGVTETETNDDEEEPTAADWRRGRTRKRLQTPNAVAMASRPTEAVDMWSFGCLLFEAATGSKLFRAGDKLASVLRPQQLLEMRSGETEVRYASEDALAGGAAAFTDAKSLISACLAENPQDRISAAAAVKHHFLMRKLRPPPKTELDSLIPRIDLSRPREDSTADQVIADIRQEAEKFGAVTQVTSKGSHVFVEFEEEASQRV